MKISTTRLTAVLILATQWICVASLIIAGNLGRSPFSPFKDFGTYLPAPTIITLRLIYPASLIPIAALTTSIVFVAECFLTSEWSRFVIQIVNLCLWLIFASLVLFALMIPLGSGPLLIEL
jgi:hypothetical protein